MAPAIRATAAMSAWVRCAGPALRPITRQADEEVLVVGREGWKLMTLAWTCWRHSLHGACREDEANVTQSAYIRRSTAFKCWLQQARADRSKRETTLALLQHSTSRARLRTCWHRLRVFVLIEQNHGKLRQGHEREEALRVELEQLRGDHEEGIARIQREVEAERQRADAAETDRAIGKEAGCSSCLKSQQRSQEASDGSIILKQGEAQFYRTLCVEEAIATAEETGRARWRELEEIKRLLKRNSAATLSLVEFSNLVGKEADDAARATAISQLVREARIAHVMASESFRDALDWQWQQAADRSPSGWCWPEQPSLNLGTKQEVGCGTAGQFLRDRACWMMQTADEERRREREHWEKVHQLSQEVRAENTALSQELDRRGREFEELKQEREALEHENEVLRAEREVLSEEKKIALRSCHLLLLQEGEQARKQALQQTQQLEDISNHYECILRQQFEAITAEKEATRVAELEKAHRKRMLQEITATRKVGCLQEELDAMQLALLDAREALSLAQRQAQEDAKTQERLRLVLEVEKQALACRVRDLERFLAEREVQWALEKSQMLDEMEKERAQWRADASHPSDELRTLFWRSHKTLKVVADRDSARNRIAELEGHLSALTQRGGQTDDSNASISNASLLMGLADLGDHPDFLLEHQANEHNGEGVVRGREEIAHVSGTQRDSAASTSPLPAAVAIHELEDRIGILLREDENKSADDTEFEDDSEQVAEKNEDEDTEQDSFVGKRPGRTADAAQVLVARLKTLKENGGVGPTPPEVGEVIMAREGEMEVSRDQGDASGDFDEGAQSTCGQPGRTRWPWEDAGGYDDGDETVAVGDNLSGIDERRDRGQLKGAFALGWSLWGDEEGVSEGKMKTQDKGENEEEGQKDQAALKPGKGLNGGVEGVRAKSAEEGVQTTGADDDEEDEGWRTRLEAEYEAELLRGRHLDAQVAAAAQGQENVHIPVVGILRTDASQQAPPPPPSTPARDPESRRLGRLG